MTIRVYLVDDHDPFRTYLKALLEREPDLQVSGEAASGEQAIASAAACAPQPLADVLLVDVAMPGLGGVETARRLLALAPSSRLLALSLHDDAAFIHAMAGAGARGYLLKSGPLPRLLQAIRDVATAPA